MSVNMIEFVVPRAKPSIETLKNQVKLLEQAL